MEIKHTLTDEELDNLIRVGSIRVDQSYIDKICSYCKNEPVCYCSVGRCDYLRKQIVAKLKDLTSDQLMDLVFNNKKYEGKKDGGHKD